MKLFDIKHVPHLPNIQRTEQTSYFMYSLDKKRKYEVTESNYTSFITDKFFTKRGYGICYIEDIVTYEMIIDVNFNVSIPSKYDHRYSGGGITNITGSDFFEVNRSVNLQVYHGLEEILKCTKPCNIYYESEILMVSQELFTTNNVVYFTKYGRKIGECIDENVPDASGIFFNTSQLGEEGWTNKFGITLYLDMYSRKEAEELFQELCPKEYDYIFYKLLG